MKVLYFSTPWCGPCKALKPIVQSVSSETGIQVEYIDAQLQPNIAATYSITSVPTIIGLDSFGGVKFRHTGMTSKQQIESLFKK